MSAGREFHVCGAATENARRATEEQQNHKVSPSVCRHAENILNWRTIRDVEMFSQPYRTTCLENKTSCSGDSRDSMHCCLNGMLIDSAIFAAFMVVTKRQTTLHRDICSTRPPLCMLCGLTIRTTILPLAMPATTLFVSEVKRTQLTDTGSRHSD